VLRQVYYFCPFTRSIAYDTCGGHDRALKNRLMGGDFFMGRSLRTMTAWTMAMLLSMPTFAQVVLATCSCAPSDSQIFSQRGSSCCCLTAESQPVDDATCRHCRRPHATQRKSGFDQLSKNTTQCCCSDCGHSPFSSAQLPHRPTRGSSEWAGDIRGCGSRTPAFDANLTHAAPQSGDFWRLKRAQIVFGVWLM
jgi:hypothetical protein